MTTYQLNLSISKFWIYCLDSMAIRAYPKTFTCTFGWGDLFKFAASWSLATDAITI